MKFRRILTSLFFFLFFADDRGMKTKSVLVKNIFKLYLRVNRLGKSRGKRCRVLYPKLLVILLVCE